MRFAYLILAHQNPAQVRLLIERLLRDDADDHVILHFDGRATIADDVLAALAMDFPHSVTLTRRIPTRWGHPTLCTAELVLMEALHGKDFDIAHLISGQDWPIRSKAEMIADIAPGDCFVTLETDGMPHRMDDHHFHNSLIAPTLELSFLTYHLRRGLRQAGRIWDDALRAAGRPRTCPFGADWKRGSQWWSLSTAAVDYLIPALRHALWSGRLHHTVCSDEHVVQTILYYSPFADRIKDNRRHISWTGESSPATLTRSSLPALRTSDAWFARKLDLDRDPFFLAL